MATNQDRSVAVLETLADGDHLNRLELLASLRPGVIPVTAGQSE